MHLVLDLSLTIAKPWLHQPTGIDRVEFAHTRHWRGLPERDVTFVMRTAWDRLAAIPDGLARDILTDVDSKVAPGMQGLLPMLRAKTGFVMTQHFYGLGRHRLRQRISARPDSVFLTVSCATLHMHPCIRDLRRMGCRMVPLLFDTIPLTHPQYFPAHEKGRHALRMQAVSEMAEAGLVDSASALQDLRTYFSAAKLDLPPMSVARPGIDLPGRRGQVAAPPQDRPYFVMLGSLEPRKNHLLMLQLWQTLKDRADAPRLYIIGRRPYEAHTATMTLDRGEFGGLVQDLGRRPDGEVAALLAGARALLFPSIWEGFGIPVVEALAMGVPVLASDIAPFHEAGGVVPDFIDPLDGPGWRQAVLDYAAPDSPRRAAQLARLPGWRAPSWEEHFRVAEEVLHRVAAAPPRPGPF